MQNQKVFEEYNTEKWVIEQNLCFMLHEYWDKYCKDRFHSEMPHNPVSFVKDFLKEESFCDIEFAEKSKMETIKANAIDIEDIQ